MSELINLIGGETKWAEHQLKEVFEFEQDLSKVRNKFLQLTDQKSVRKFYFEILKVVPSKTNHRNKWGYIIIERVTAIFNFFFAQAIRNC